jgi:hypothetical protein
LFFFFFWGVGGEEDASERAQSRARSISCLLWLLCVSISI